jgi:flagellar biosynthesis protein FlhG
MRPDQAEGLRRLLDRNRLRVVAISAGAGGRGKTAAIINLAGALAELGSDVQILDENQAAEGVTAALGLAARFDLEDVIRRERDLDEVIVRGPAGILILPLARGARSLALLPAPEQQWLVERCGRLGFPVDTLLVDAASGSASPLLWPGTAAQEVIVLAGGSAAAITAAYALIKRLSSEFARREFHILVSDVASEGEARTIFGNMARAARRYLQVSLDFMGYIPPDDKLRHAARLRLPVVAAFPRAAAAGSFRRLAQTVSGWPQAEEDGSGFDDFMRRLIHSNRAHTAAAQTSL